jgi:hypothetical protein
MPMGILLLEILSGLRWWAGLMLLAVVLQRMEPKADGGPTSSSSPIKLVGGSNPMDSAGQSSMQSHHGDGCIGEDACWLRLRSGLRGAQAAGVTRSSSVGDSRRRRPSCPCYLWLKGGPPQPQDDGASSSRRKAIAEDLQLLLPGTSQHRCPKWPVPGGGGAGTDDEWFSSERWQRTRLLFVDLLKGSWCKFAGPECTFLFSLDLSVNCKTTAGI